MASGGRAPRSRTTRVAASRCSAGSTASRYGSPPRSGVAVEARKTVIAVTSGSLTRVGGIGPRPLLTRAAAWGQELVECSPRAFLFFEPDGQTGPGRLRRHQASASIAYLDHLPTVAFGDAVGVMRCVDRKPLVNRTAGGAYGVL